MSMCHEASAKTIWESPKTSEDFVFEKYEKIFLTIALFSNESEKNCLNILEKSLNKRGEVLKFNDSKKQISGAIGESRLFFYVSSIRTENPNINGLRIFAATGVQARYNQENTFAYVWEKSFLFENKNDLDEDMTQAMEKAIPAFINQFFETNPEAKGNVVFYYPNSSSS